MGLGSWVLGLGSWVLGLGSWFLALGSWLLALGSWLLALGSWLLPLGSYLLSLGSRLLALGSWLPFLAFWFPYGFHADTPDRDRVFLATGDQDPDGSRYGELVNFNTGKKYEDNDVSPHVLNLFGRLAWLHVNLNVCLCPLLYL